MSRSFRKNPIITDQSTTHNAWKMKRLANKKVRQTWKIKKEEIPNGSAYKQCMCSWDINDYSFKKTKKEVISSYYANQNAIANGASSAGIGWYISSSSLEEQLIDWYKSYKRK